MSTIATALKLPSAGPAREALRERGQFWTPDWVAEAMVSYAVSNGSDTIFDPTVGAGAFFRAAKQVGKETARNFRLVGMEIDRAALEKSVHNGLSAEDVAGVTIQDFLLNPPPARFNSIVANPPYIRHHRLDMQLKSHLQSFGARLMGKPLDGRTGAHVYFLLHALQMLAPQGRLAFILPADVCEGISAPTLWNWITKNYKLDAVIAFSPNASPFLGVDTNPLVFLIRNSPREGQFLWVRCNEPNSQRLKEWIASGFTLRSNGALTIYRRSLAEGLATGFSRPPLERDENSVALGELAKVLRGVATGANEFFFLTEEQAESYHIPPEFLLRAVGRTRDAPENEITKQTMKKLASAGRPTLLFSPDGRPMGDFPSAVRNYLRQGEAMGLPTRPLIASRQPWYKMEKRIPPPLLFAYLGRRNARFIRNFAEVTPLTGFLCVYPRSLDSAFVDNLWRALGDPRTIANLPRVGKSYGDGCIKVEPRSLERLPIPSAVISQYGLSGIEQLLPMDVSPQHDEKAVVLEKKSQYSVQKQRILNGIKRGERAAKAGRVVPHSKVKKFVKKWTSKP